MVSNTMFGCRTMVRGNRDVGVIVVCVTYHVRSMLPRGRVLVDDVRQWSTDHYHHNTRQTWNVWGRMVTRCVNVCVNMCMSGANDP